MIWLLIGVGVIGAGLLWAHLVKTERGRFAWVFWGWVLLVAVNAVGFGLELVGYRF